MKRGLIIGGGAIGLSIAESLAPLVDELYVVEKERRFGEHASSRSSEVMHAGIYYKPGSWKARLCVEGHQLLQQFCRESSVPYLLCGKLLVARTTTDEEILRSLQRRAEENGVKGTRIIDQDEVIALGEPNVRCSAALYVPSSGTVDTAAYLQALEKRAADRGVSLVKNTLVTRIERKGSSFAVTTSIQGKEQQLILADILVNAAGVHSDTVAKMVYPQNTWEIVPVRCEAMYFIPNRPDLQTSMHIYGPPVTHEMGDRKTIFTTGVHTTRTLSGRNLVTPLYAENTPQREDYSLTRPAEDFLEKVGWFFPNLQKSDLRPHQAGIQPKLKTTKDFVLEPDKAYDHCFHCVSVDSPGITASQAIKRVVSEYFA